MLPGGMLEDLVKFFIISVVSYVAASNGQRNPLSDERMVSQFVSVAVGIVAFWLIRPPMSTSDEGYDPVEMVPFGGTLIHNIDGKHVILVNQPTIGTPSGASATASFFPTNSFQISFDAKFMSNAVGLSRQMVSYGRFSLQVFDGGSIGVVVDYGTPGAIASTLIPNIVPEADETNSDQWFEHRFMIKRTVYADPDLSTVEVYIDGVRRLVIRGADSAIPNVQIAQPVSLTFGGTEYCFALAQYDNVRIEVVHTPTNSNADGAGLAVMGDGLVNKRWCDRSITWNKNVTQEQGDYRGSYWHVKGGQIMFSRVIDSGVRKAPGSGVLLSSLPVKSLSAPLTEPHMWKLAAYTSNQPTAHVSPDSVSSLALEYSGTIPPHHEGGYFETKYGLTGFLTSFYSAAAVARAGSDILYTGVVKPITSLSAAIGGYSGAEGEAMTAPFACDISGSVNTAVDMVELVTIGYPDSVDAYVSVWVWRGGRILLTTGLKYTETAYPVVGSREFVLGILMGPTSPELFINGVKKTLAPWRTIATNDVSPSQIVSVASLQSSAGLTVNSLGAIDSDAVDVVMEVYNKR
eukprot:jgi/Mesvir1/8022/Mv04433-RA.1